MMESRGSGIILLFPTTKPFSLRKCSLNRHGYLCHSMQPDFLL
jgi:hypothetical protein